MPAWKNKHAKPPKAPKYQSPKPSEIYRARIAAGVTKADAARLVYVAQQTWESWENAQTGVKMHPAFAELFAIKTGLKQPEPFKREYILGPDGWDKLPLNNETE